jgi:ketosteroid isomerase-like protein
MATINEDVIHSFYSAFQRKDYRTMQSLYHEEAVFSDPVFRNLNAGEVRAMWEMLLKASSDLRVEFTNIVVNDESGSCHWVAWYTFSKTGRKVHNVIDASFTFRDGRILTHRDSFDLWRWSAMALGPSGLLLGWTPLLRNKIRKLAAGNLTRFMQS